MVYSILLDDNKQIISYTNEGTKYRKYIKSEIDDINAANYNNIVFGLRKNGLCFEKGINYIYMEYDKYLTYGYILLRNKLLVCLREEKINILI